ncbi:YceI family protein [Hymenobacter chitinivorans]|uniref:Polyisoprenoid-binding protein YceI n=1 Tax=Hymenobacter chitinivorans DSM 11115 TaxID=1121954 RepID=A0A2M9BML7_9BACT|nr:YceI family protein [Hymenobacter chitinivorans]PJJ59204.1 polyisoprenoid-binding protein YceI [Hymenobacter chitinivorans DSM 11115]
MKKFALSALFIASIMAAPAVAKDPSAPKAATSTKAGTVYKVQPQLSTLGWVGKKVTGQHSGTIQFKSGDVEVKGAQITGGTFVIDMNSLKVTDITDADTNGKLMGHLRSDDFFSIDKNATSTFKITKITPIKGAAADANNATVTGNLTIKGITKPISFPAKIGVKNGVAAASGTATIDRTQFDIKYGSKSFFESIGDKAIDNDFTLSFNVIAKQ